MIWLLRLKILSLFSVIIRNPYLIKAHNPNFVMPLPRTRDAQWRLFSSKFQTFGLGQTFWADKFGGIWGIFVQILVLWVPCPCFPLIMDFFISRSPCINQPWFLQKTKLLYPHPKYLFGIGIWFGPQRIRDLAIVCP